MTGSKALIFIHIVLIHGKLLGALLAIALAGSVALLLAALSGSRADPESGNAVVVQSPFGLYGPGTLDQVPASAGREMIKALGMNSLTAYQDYSLGLVKELGASWVRIDFNFDGWNFAEPSDFLTKLHNAGLEVVACIRPVNNFAPADLTVFQAGLRGLVRRYPWITVWQIGNEPNISWENPDEYPRFFLAGEQAVREACPSCRIALAGVAAKYPSQSNDGEALQIYDRIVGEIVKQAPEGSRPFDIFDLHYYGYYGCAGDIVDSIDSFHQLLARHGVDAGTDFWVTETATPTGRPAWPWGSPAQTEDQQAAELVKRFTVMLSAGVSHVSWARPYENYRYQDNAGSFYDYSGLVYNGLGREQAAGVKAGTKKKAFFAYRTLVAKTSGAVRIKRLNWGQYRFTFKDGRPPLYLLWSETSADMPAGLSGPVTVTDMNGKQTQTAASDVILGSMPVFVESRPAV